MRNGIWLALLCLATVGVARAQGAIELEEVVSGLDQPLGLVAPGDGSERLFIVEQAGRVLVLEDRAVREVPFLDLSSSVRCCDERGLLGLAFHPDYESNGLFFVNYTDRAGDTVVSRFSVSSADPNRADIDSEIALLTFDQPFANHNGGHIAFGPDGYLYIASGDGGSGGDPQNNAQSLDNLLGKILRIDVDGSPVAIPPDNPFVNDSSARAEIWAFGLRNPWRFGFDRETGDLFIGDVGQNAVEEIDLQPAGSPGGENYGWRRMEGSSCFNPSNSCDTGDLVTPILEYRHDQGCSVTGGYRYRGSRSPGLEGVYVFGDFCSGRIWGATPGAGGEWSFRQLADTDLGIASFGEDEDGEIYAVDLGGAIYRIATAEIFHNGFESGDFSGWKKRGKPGLTSPGLEGTGFALAVRADSGRPRVRARVPGREAEVALELSIDPSGLERLSREEVVVALTDGKTVEVEMTLERVAKRFRVALYVHGSEGARRVARTKISAKRSTRLTLTWRAAPDDGSPEGFASLARNGRVRGARSDLDTAERRINSFEAGFPLGTSDGSGVLLLDEFAFSRSPG